MQGVQLTLGTKLSFGHSTECLGHRLSQARFERKVRSHLRICLMVLL